MCLNAQLQLSRPKYLRARLLKGDEIFVFPKKPTFFDSRTIKKSRQIVPRRK